MAKKKHILYLSIYYKIFRNKCIMYEIFLQ